MKKYLDLKDADGKPSDFSALKYSVHLWDKRGQKLADIDEKGIVLYDDELNLSVCETTGDANGWKQQQMIYVSEELRKLSE